MAESVRSTNESDVEVLLESTRSTGTWANRKETSKRFGEPWPLLIFKHGVFQIIIQKNLFRYERTLYLDFMKTWHIIKESALVTTMSFHFILPAHTRAGKKKYYKVMPGGVDFEVCRPDIYRIDETWIINDTNIVICWTGGYKRRDCWSAEYPEQIPPEGDCCWRLPFSSEGEQLENLEDGDGAGAENDWDCDGLFAGGVTPALHAGKRCIFAAAKDSWLSISTRITTSVLYIIHHLPGSTTVCSVLLRHLRLLGCMMIRFHQN